MQKSIPTAQVSQHSDFFSVSASETADFHDLETEVGNAGHNSAGQVMLAEPMMNIYPSTSYNSSTQSAPFSKLPCPLQRIMNGAKAKDRAYPWMALTHHYFDPKGQQSRKNGGIGGEMESIAVFNTKWDLCVAYGEPGTFSSSLSSAWPRSHNRSGAAAEKDFNFTVREGIFSNNSHALRALLFLSG